MLFLQSWICRPIILGLKGNRHGIFRLDYYNPLFLVRGWRSYVDSSLHTRQQHVYQARKISEEALFWLLMVPDPVDGPAGQILSPHNMVERNVFHQASEELSCCLHCSPEVPYRITCTPCPHAVGRKKPSLEVLYIPFALQVCYEDKVHSQEGRNRICIHHLYFKSTPGPQVRTRAPLCLVLYRTKFLFFGLLFSWFMLV